MGYLSSLEVDWKKFTFFFSPNSFIRWMLSHFSDFDPMDGSPPGPSVHGILQVRTLEWLAISSCWGSSQSMHRICLLCLLHWQEGSLPLVLLGKPFVQWFLYNLRHVFIEPLHMYGSGQTVQFTVFGEQHLWEIVSCETQLAEMTDTFSKHFACEHSCCASGG